MKTLFLALFITAVAGLEFHHEYSSNQAQAAVCMAPETQQAAVKDTILQHLLNH